MGQLKVKTESLPTRCDICHQTDRFDATRNYCDRCSGVSDILALQARALDLRERLTRMRSMYSTEGFTALNQDRRMGMPIWLAIPGQVFFWITLGFTGLGGFMGLVSFRILNGLLLGAVSGIVLGTICGIITATAIISVLTIKWIVEEISILINRVRRP